MNQNDPVLANLSYYLIFINSYFTPINAGCLLIVICLEDTGVSSISGKQRV